MRPQDIKIDEFYRLRSTPDYSFIQAKRILKPKEYPNTHKYIIVECNHVVNKNDGLGFKRYFRPVDMVTNT